MTIRCILDDLLLHAEMYPGMTQMLAYDGDESFLMEAVEAAYYEVVSATPEEIARVQQARYRLLRFAEDFQTVS